MPLNFKGRTSSVKTPTAQPRAEVDLPTAHCGSTCRAGILGQRPFAFGTQPATRAQPRTATAASNREGKHTGPATWPRARAAAPPAVLPFPAAKQTAGVLLDSDGPLHNRRGAARAGLKLVRAPSATTRQPGMERSRFADMNTGFRDPPPTTSSESSGPTEAARADPRNQSASARPQLTLGPADVESIKARVPSTIPCHSINGTFKGTFHLHEYLSTSATSSSYARLKACVSQDGSAGRMTPREAEMRAGKGSRKSWKLTLMTMHNGQEMSLQKYFTLLGIEKPGQAMDTSRQDLTPTNAVEPSETRPSRQPWASLSRDEWLDEPHSKRQHLQSHSSMLRRSTEESGTSAWPMQSYSPNSLATLSRSSNQDAVLLTTRPSVATQYSPEMPDTLGHRPSLQFTTLTTYSMRPSPSLSLNVGPGAVSVDHAGVDTGPALLASLAAASSGNRTSAPAPSASESMGSLLRRIELNRRMSAGSVFTAGQMAQLTSSSSAPVGGLTAHDMDRWQQTTMLGPSGSAGLLQSQARQMLTASPSYMPAGSRGMPHLVPVGSGPVTAYLLPAGVSLGGLGQQSLGPLQRSMPYHDSAGLIHLARDLPQQSMDRLRMPTALTVHAIPRFSDPSGSQRLADVQQGPPLVFQSPNLPRLFDNSPAPGLSEPLMAPRLSATGSVALRHHSVTSPISGEVGGMGAAPGPSMAMAARSMHSRPDPGPSSSHDSGELMAPLLDKPDLSKVPLSIPIFTQNQEVYGTLFLHDYINGTLARPNRPPPCVVLPGSDTPVTPRVAEAKAGREARKNWKESFRTTLPDGRVISIKAFFAMHNIS